MAGGIDWFRWHHGSVTDPKFQLVARRAGASLPAVLAIWAYLLEKASAAEMRGVFGDIDAEAVDCLFGLDDGQTAAVLAQMTERKLIDGWHVIAWERRQPRREREDDGAADRKRQQRERQRLAAEANALLDAASEVTPDVTDYERVTPCHATSHQKTPRGEESRGEKKTSVSGQEGETRKRVPPQPCPDDVDSQVWADWLALRKAKRAPVSATVMDGARSEAAKAGMTLEAFLKVWCRRGSQGLEASWLKPEERTGQPAEPAWRTEQRERMQKALGPYAVRPKPDDNVIDMETAHAARILG